MQTPSKSESEMNSEAIFKKSVLKIKGYQSPPQSHVKAKLNQNENPFDVPVEVKAMLADRIAKLDWNRYPVNESPALRKKLAAWHHLQPQQILLGNGSNQLLQTILSATVNDGDKVCWSSPTFSLFSLFSALYNAVPVDIRQTRALQFPYEAFIAGVENHQPRVILLCSPNNPTGSEINLDFLRTLCSRATGLVFWDEAYAEFTDQTAIELLSQYSNLVISRTFSKAFSLAGLRFGYLIANKTVIEQLEKVNLPYNVNIITEAVVSELLECRDILFERVDQVVEQRQKMYKELCLIPELTVYPSKANFILFKCQNSRSVFQTLKKHGILVRDVSSYPLLENHLRVNVGSPEENKYFLDILHTIR
jgi:histidinol-phosphate aminotransferase